MVRLRLFDDLLLKWQKAINLIGPGTVADRWRRHYLDSAQLQPLAEAGHWLDLGSGAGFPGLVLAILGIGEMHLVESDQRKVLFLREAARLTGAPVTVHHGRIETSSAPKAGVITARALAPLPNLLDLAERFVAESTVLLLPKGQDVEQELTAATKYWSMEVERLPSQTDPAGVILRLKGLRRVRPA